MEPRRDRTAADPRAAVPGQETRRPPSRVAFVHCGGWSRRAQVDAARGVNGVAIVSTGRASPPLGLRRTIQRLIPIATT